MFAIGQSHGVAQPDPFESMRHRMVKEQIEARGINDPAVIAAMKKVKRHHFVPEKMMAYAYLDGPLQIGNNQTISQPYIVAYMTEALRLKPWNRVLEIGTGSGYQAAILSEIVDMVYTVEIIPELGNSAKEALRKMACDNVLVKIGDGYHGWKEFAPYDAIIVTAAPREIPPPLLDQLKEGGRLIIPVGHQTLNQELILIEKRGGELIRKRMIPVRFVPFTREK